MGLVLILVLSYAVYSNTVDSEYYGYHTSNEEVNYQLDQSDENLSSWFVTTSSSATWVNVSVLNAPADSTLTVTSTDSIWYHSVLLGQEGDAVFNCKEFDDVSESCISSYSHSLTLETGDGNLIGRSSLVLPIDGIGFLHAKNQSVAEQDATSIVENERVLTSWIIEVSKDGALIDDAGIEINFTLVEHELISVEEFKLEPIQEAAYATATLVGCFGLLIAVPMIAYYAGVAKSRLEEENRADEPPPSE